MNNLVKRILKVYSRRQAFFTLSQACETRRFNLLCLCLKQFGIFECPVTFFTLLSSKQADKAILRTKKRAVISHTQLYGPLQKMHCTYCNSG